MILRNRIGGLGSVKTETGKEEKPIHADFIYLIITAGNPCSVLVGTL